MTHLDLVTHAPAHLTQDALALLEQARDLDLDYLVSLNVVCHRQLVAGVKRARLRVKVIHLAELLELAL